ncbi:hypothetical protein RJ639_020891 [Escallonia herrerae]|uniref:Dirigent protein n=1 Tax=Escallonia herrerae TaxID=1293975 RepID=A0AA88V8Q3_9ASTE|nr:hypothetical protein RJ639_020891 [Escallonia herrerae]
MAYTSKTLKTIIYLLLLAITIGCATSARILDEASPELPVTVNDSEGLDPADDPDVAVAPVVGPATTLPSGQIPATTTTVPAPVVAPIVGPSIPLPAPITTATATVAPVADVPNTVVAPVADVAPLPIPAATSPTGAGAITAIGATAAQADPQHPALSFFMHDILGGSHPSGRVVTGIIANSEANGLPFSKPNSQVFPINGGVPLNNLNGLINNNNVPFLVGLNGSPTSTVVQNNGNNNAVTGGNNLPFVTAGQLPAGITLQKLMFGSITVVDNELTEGHELGSAVLGKGQGFYLSSSLDGSSHTLALTTLFHGGDHEVDDTISFFGVHRTASQVSHIAVIGGTGKYEHAKGYATIETLHQEDQHTTDGVETITHFTVYLTS